LIAELLADESLPKDERESFVADIQEQSRHMLGLLNALLDVSKIESGTFSINKIPVALAKFIDDTVERHARLAELKGTRVVCDGAAEGEVEADPMRLGQIMDNLISNAVKFSPPGSTVRIGAVENGEGWRIHVRDQGPGLTPGDREQLFQDFARLTAQPTAGEKSTGLGLAIARRVVEAHGGQIGVDSEPGQGATFWFTLPAPGTEDGTPDLDKGL
jgi:signal transduction histidine kinase